MPIREPSMTSPIAALTDVPFDEAIAFAEARDVVLPDVYYDELQGAARAQAFTVSHLTSLRQIGQVFDALAAALRDGLTFEAWTQRVADGGVELEAPHRETVFRTA